MWIAYIGGWESCSAISDTETKAKRLCMKEWKRNCAEDVQKWSWNKIADYCGAGTYEFQKECVLHHDDAVVIDGKRI